MSVRRFSALGLLLALASPVACRGAGDSTAPGASLPDPTQGRVLATIDGVTFNASESMGSYSNPLLGVAAKDATLTVNVVIETTAAGIARLSSILVTDNTGRCWMTTSGGLRTASVSALQPGRAAGNFAGDLEPLCTLTEGTRTIRNGTFDVPLLP